jgi:hypothetical protein
LLDDLADLFADLRTWRGIVGKHPGVFYLGSQPFLHFHLLEENRRRADIKGRTDWMQVDLPRPASAATKRALLRELQLRYGEKRRQGAA